MSYLQDSVWIQIFWNNDNNEMAMNHELLCNVEQSLWHQFVWNSSPGSNRWNFEDFKSFGTMTTMKWQWIMSSLQCWIISLAPIRLEQQSGSNRCDFEELKSFSFSSFWTRECMRSKACLGSFKVDNWVLGANRQAYPHVFSVHSVRYILFLENNILWKMPLIECPHGFSSSWQYILKLRGPN